MVLNLMVLYIEPHAPDLPSRRRLDRLTGALKSTVWAVGFIALGLLGLALDY